MSAAQQFTDALRQSLADASFIKLTLSGYHGAEAGLQKILARRILVKRQEKLSFTYRYKTRDVVKNYDAEEAVQRVARHLAEFTSATLFTAQQDVHFDGRAVKTAAPTQKPVDSLAHDRVKTRLVATDRPYLQALGITDANGKVLPSAQDKYRQIDKYIEVIRGLVGKLPKQSGLRVADMGAGKGYLTFALYDFLTGAGHAPQVVGVEYRDDLVALCNDIARASEFTQLRFEQGTIGGFDATGTDMLIALHACDTATDDAIAKGIRAGASVILAAPCCHRQVRREMEAATTEPTLKFLLRHGTLMERQAEMVTDGLRALLLELHGYRTKLFEFISDAHTPKNVMIAAVKEALPSAARQAQLRAEIDAAKKQFGVRRHHLEGLLA